MSRVLNREDRGLLIVLALTALMVVTLLLTGCMKPVYAELSASARVVEAAAENFPTWSRAKRESIVKAAKTKAEGEAALQAWDSTADKLAKAIEGVYEAHVLAKDGIKAVNDGLASKAQLSGWISSALKLAVELGHMLGGLGFHVGGIF